MSFTQIETISFNWTPQHMSHKVTQDMP